MTKTFTLFPADSFLAENIINFLINKGQEVRAIVRDKDKTNYFESVKSKYPNFHYRVISVGDEPSLKKEFDLSDVIIHTSYSLKKDYNFNEKVLKCVDSFMKCCKDSRKLKKVIYISTLGAICDLDNIAETTKAGNLITESSRNENLDQDKDIQSWLRSNLETRFIELAKQYNLNYTILNTGLFVGPLQTKRFGFSVRYMKSFFDENRTIENSYPLIDIRDIANICYNIIEIESAAERYLVCHEYLTHPREISEILQKNCKNLKVPTQEKTGDRTKFFDSSKVLKDLRLQFRPVETSIVDMVKSMVECDLIK